MATKSYIVCLKDDTSEADYKRHVEDIEKKGGKVEKHFGDVMKGFSCKLPEDHVQTLSEDPTIQFVEPDSEVSIQ